MSKATVSLSRKISRDYNSTGYTVNIEGEITAPLDQPQAVLKQIQYLFKLAEDAVAQEIDRDQGDDAQGRRDEEPGQANGNGRAPAQTPQQNGNGQPELATQKQLNYLQNLAKRQQLSTIQLGDRIAETLGQRVLLNQLTKREAGQVIDALTKNAPANGRR